MLTEAGKQAAKEPLRYQTHITQQLGFKSNLNIDRSINRPYQATGNELRGQPPARTLYCKSNWSKLDTARIPEKQHYNLEQAKSTIEVYPTKI